MKLLSSLIGILVLGSLSACAGSAKTPDIVFERWQAMGSSSHGENLCYIGTAPVQMKGTLKKRSTQPYLMVTRRASGNMEISVSSGYSYMAGSRVVLATDGEEHTLFFKDNVAWAHNNAEDGAILDAMEHADTIEVLGVSQKGLTSTDDYSSSGLSAALAYIRGHCK